MGYWGIGVFGIWSQGEESLLCIMPYAAHEYARGGHQKKRQQTGVDF